MMYATYHLQSAQEVSADILDAIKATFKSKSITIIVEEDEENNEVNAEMKGILDERLLENEETYLTAAESVNQINKKFGI